MSAQTAAAMGLVGVVTLGGFTCRSPTQTRLPG